MRTLAKVLAGGLLALTLAAPPWVGPRPGHDHRYRSSHYDERRPQHDGSGLLIS